MRSFVQPGDVITVTAPYALTSGQGALVGNLFGMAVADAANGASVDLRVTGVVSGEKTTGEAWTVGARIYWNNSTRRFTTTLTGNTLVGVATVAALAAATTGSVRLNGSF